VARSGGFPDLINNHSPVILVAAITSRKTEKVSRLRRSLSPRKEACNNARRYCWCSCDLWTNGEWWAGTAESARSSWSGGRRS